MESSMDSEDQVVENVSNFKEHHSLRTSSDIVISTPLRQVEPPKTTTCDKEHFIVSLVHYCIIFNNN